MSWLINSGLWTNLVNADLWQSTLREATPLALAALGGTISERSGVVNIAMEGMMLTGAFFAVLLDVNYQNLHFTLLGLGPAAVGLLAAMVTGTLMAGILAFSAVRLRADQIIIGMAVNLLALGLTGYLLNSVYGTNGTPSSCAPPTPCAKGQVFTIPDWSIPGLNRLPAIGQIIFQQNPLVYLMLLLVVLVHLFLFRTKLGLRIRAVGEHPRAADTAGIDVQLLRYLAVTLSGMLSGLAGGYLALVASVGSFSDNMTAGLGFIALAAVIFGKWRPFGAFGACLLFGFGLALYHQLQNQPNLSIGSFNFQDFATMLAALPYVLTIVALAGFIGRSIPPAADGIPYDPAGGS